MSEPIDTNEKVLTRIKRLMALSNDCTYPEEAKQALAKAYELMARHNIKAEDVDEHVIGEKYLIDSIGEFGRDPVEAVYVNSILTKFFFVRVILKKIPVSQFNYHYHYVIFGKESNVDVGKYLFVSLVRQFKNLWIKYKQEGHISRRYKEIEVQNQYYRGLHDGIYRRLTTTVVDGGECNALVRINDDVEKNFKMVLGDIGTRKQGKNANTDIWYARLDGVTDSSKIRLNKGLDSGATKELTS